MTLPIRDETYFAPYDVVMPVLVAIVAKAKVSVNLSIYRLTSHPLVDALIAAQARGVPVHVVHDWSQSTDPVCHAQLQRLVNGGVDLLIGQSVKNQLVHDKYLIGDSEVVAFGSYNFSPTAQLEDNTLHVRSKAAVVAKFVANWQQVHDDTVGKHPEWQLVPTV